MQSQAVQFALIKLPLDGRLIPVLGKAVVGNNLPAQVGFEIAEPPRLAVQPVAGMQKLAPVWLEFVLFGAGVVLAIPWNQFVYSWRGRLLQVLCRQHQL